MAHKPLIGGTAYEIKGGKTLVEGTAYSIKNGKTLVGGTIYEIGFGSNAPIILEVEKITSDTYAGETTYTGEQFILLDIYPKTNGTVTVTYGGLTKTVTDTSGAAEPNAQPVYFGTFNGVSDSVATPTSGELTIEGKFAAFAVGTYAKDSSLKNSNTPCSCITAVSDLSGITSIPARAFDRCTKITDITISDSVESVIASAFYGCTGLTTIDVENGNGFYSSENGVLFTAKKLMLVKYPLGKTSTQYTIPSSVTSIGTEAFYDCSTITNYTFPASVRSIESSAFALTRGNRTLTFLGTTPPTLPKFSDGSINWPFGSCVNNIVVPKGCRDVYITAGYAENDDDQYITEAS